MIHLSAAWVAAAAGGRVVAGDPEAAGPRRAVVDSRVAGPGDLFVGLPGERADGGAFAADAVAAGAWGALVRPEHAAALGEGSSRSEDRGGAVGSPAAGPATVIAAADPLAALQRLARAWRRQLGAAVVGITGSTGKTSTKDILTALLRPHRRTHSSRENLNTEVGLPLSILEAASGTEVLVLEMAMRGEGQIAELAAIAEPDVGVIVNVGPVHLELLGTVERVAAAKAELIRDLRPGATAVIPASEPLLDAHRRDDVETTTFGPGGDVALLSLDAASGRAEIEAGEERLFLELPYRQPHNLLNTLAAVAAARAVGVTPRGRVEVDFSPLRGQEVELPGGVTVVNDCYNANPMSMRAALEHLAAAPARRRIAVLGEMAELGPDAARFHIEVAERAGAAGIDVLVAVGEGARAYLQAFGRERHGVASPEEAGALLERIAGPGDRVLVKGSRSAGLERVLGDAR